MSDLKIGYRAVFYVGKEKDSSNSVKETYDEAVKDIETENERVTANFTHAQVEKVYYRH